MHNSDCLVFRHPYKGSIRVVFGRSNCKRVRAKRGVRKFVRPSICTSTCGGYIRNQATLPSTLMLCGCVMFKHNERVGTGYSMVWIGGKKALGRERGKEGTV